MGYQPLEKLLPRANYSIYKLVCLAAKRAMELADGQPKLINASPSTKTATLALEEILAGKVVLKEAASQPVNTKKYKSEKTEEETVELEQGV